MLSLINTLDVSLWHVLKNAKDVAPYGVRGSNGVIVITTKKGLKPGPTLKDLLLGYGYNKLKLMKKYIIILFLYLKLFFSQNFTRQDTLRGSITPERAWWDLTYYHLDISVDPENKFIKGSNIVQYKVLESNDEIQIDLQKPLKITKVLQDNKELTFRLDGYSHFIKLEEKTKKRHIKFNKSFL